jgi:hypothetical protein
VRLVGEVILFTILKMVKQLILAMLPATEINTKQQLQICVNFALNFVQPVIGMLA